MEPWSPPRLKLKTRRGATLDAKSPIPEKLFFRIGEVAKLVGVEPHVLRYWEREVPGLTPGKTASNQRRYQRPDVERFRDVRRLLYDERYTLEGTRRALAATSKSEKSKVEPSRSIEGPAKETLRRLRAGLEEILRLVESRQH